MTAAQRIGANLRRARKEAGLSLEVCALRAEIHPSGMGQYEAGRREAKAETIVRLAGALGLDPAALLEGIRWEPGEPGRLVVEDA